MPSLQVVDLTPQRGPTSPLEATLSGFVGRGRENQIQQQEADALKQIYQQHQQDGGNIQNLIQAYQTAPNLSPTRRTEAISTALKMQETNAKLQKAESQRIATQQKAQDTAAEAKNKRVEKEEKTARNREQTNIIEEGRGRKKGEGAAFADNPALYERLTKPQSKTQASQPIDEDQLQRINHTLDQPGFDELSPDQQNLALLRNGVSKENSKAVIEPRIEQAKIDAKREGTISGLQAKSDFEFYEDQVDQFPKLEAEAKTLDRATELNEEGVTGDLWDQAMEKAGLLQFTSPGRREFASLAKDAVKNQNIKSVIGSQISQMEFGFFRDATINPNFSKEANRQILRKEQLARRYKKLYADIAENLVSQNGGKIPQGLQAKTNAEFSRQAEKISREVQDAYTKFHAIQKVPKGHVLMYDEDRNPLHVPEDEVAKYKELGASLS